MTLFTLLNLHFLTAHKSYLLLQRPPSGERQFRIVAPNSVSFQTNGDRPTWLPFQTNRDDFLHDSVIYNCISAVEHVRSLQSQRVERQ